MTILREQIEALIAEIISDAKSVGYSSSGMERRAHENNLAESVRALKDLLASQQRDGAPSAVTDEMASKVLLSLPNFARYNHSESEWAEDVSAMRAAFEAALSQSTGSSGGEK
jgi:hypothetical protein